ncbi:MAG: hypothetical protein ACMXX6_00530 [Candidatus Woesearchaeota archaeon]
MKKSEIKEYLDKGYIQTIIIFEVVGNPKEHIEKTLDLLKNKIEEEKGIKIINIEKEDVEDAGEGLFGGFLEAELLIEDLYKLSYISFNYTPATIEIIEPSTFNLKDKDLTNLFSDLLAGLHENNARNVTIGNKNIGLQRNINALIKNSALYIISNEAKEAQDIANPLGLQTEAIVPFLEQMIKEGTAKKEGNKYRKL